ncbi:MAG: alpha-hydroxy-acid oxidizing protein [Acidobacteria bacterium]|nr:alpha-hydroxy-acid oxidizing protein [Acidobacteriota bacterium]
MTPLSPNRDSELVCLADYEALARERLSLLAYEYVSGGASDEVTLRWNEEAFHKIRLRQKILTDVSNLDTRVTLFGETLPYPIVLAPAAYHRLLHRDGELATARGANAVGATLVVSTMATTSVEEIAAVSSAPLWFQLYVQPDRGFTKSLVQRAEDAGCRVLCVTVDTPVIGTRNREMRLQFALPEGLDRPHLRGLEKHGETTHRPREGEIYSSTLDPSLTWKDIEWLLSWARVPVILKGVSHPDDAEKAIKTGVSGIIVSNHGARNLDTVPATIEVLPAVAERVAGRMPVLMDGGIRRGTDVLKAIALGADAVLIGRPYLYGLAVAGAAGVARVVDILRAEFAMAMALTGTTSVASLNASVLW